MKQRIHNVRKMAKLSQADFGARIGVTGAAISRIESGDREPSELVIKSVCREFGINRVWLETGEGPQYPEEVQDGPEALVPDLVGILGAYHAVMDLMRRVVRHMTPAEWQRLNQLLDETQKNPEA